MKQKLPFKIEHTVPVPQPQRGRGITGTLRACMPGDSFFVPHRQFSRTGAYTVGRHLGIKVAVRREGKGYRIWRLT